MKLYTIVLSSLMLLACGGGTEHPVATIQTSVPRPATKAAVVPGGGGVAVHMYQALYGQAPSNAMLSAYTMQATTDAPAFAKNMASNFANTGNTVLAKLVLDNLGVTAATVTAVNTQGESEYAILLDALGQLFSFYGADARGQIILNATNLLANLDSDTTYGATAISYNNQALANFTYSSNSANTVAAVVSTSTANAGAGQSVTVGTLVTLDGSASTTDIGKILTFAWTLSSKPTGSVAALSSRTATKPTFTADVAGSYVATLVVNDGAVNSKEAKVSIAVVANVAPVANAGIAQNVFVGANVTLDASASSDANSDPLQYAWTLTAKPSGSTATLVSPTSDRPTLTADVAGNYLVSLIVNDGKLSSDPVTVTLAAISISVAPPKACCRVCTTGKPCGDSCISRTYTCRAGSGCAC